MINKILEDREKRFLKQKKLVEKYKKTLIVIRVNYPGKKNTPLYKNILYVSFNKLRGIIDYTDFFYFTSHDGDTICLLTENSALEVKKQLVFIENSHQLGRLMDLDVYDKNFNQISRSDVGLDKRKCFFCDNTYQECVRKNNHNLSEVLTYIENQFLDFFKFSLTQKFEQSVLNELFTYPSFGLVSHMNQGSHKDMNFNHFISSMFSISPYISKIVDVSYNNEDINKTFLKVREIGKIAEKSMFLSTKGINTHKGLIFLSFIVILVTSKLIFSNSYEKAKNLKTDLEKQIKYVGKNILDDFKKDLNTNGYKAYKENKLLGVRGEVHNGLKNLFDKYLPFYEKEKDNVNTLLYIMSDLDDTTIVHRSDIYTLYTIKKMSREHIFKPLEKQLEYEKFLINLNLSPGGSADMLAITTLIYSILNEYTID